MSTAETNFVQMGVNKEHDLPLGMNINHVDQNYLNNNDVDI